MRWAALGEASIVVGLWSLSPILVKTVLSEVSPLQIAGIRYFLGFLALLPWMLIRLRSGKLRAPGRFWPRLALMGLLAYPIGNGLLFWGMRVLPATTSAFLLNLIPILTLMLGILFLREIPTWGQALGVGLTIFGVSSFFRAGLALPERVPLLASVAGTAALSVFGIFARQLARSRVVDTITLSAIPMAVGGGVLLLTQPWPRNLPTSAWGILAFLGIVNSALAYILWNHALTRLKAFEISVLGNLIPIGTALLAPMFLTESVEGHSWVGIGFALLGVVFMAAWPRGARVPSGPVAEPTNRAGTA